MTTPTASLSLSWSPTSIKPAAIISLFFLRPYLYILCINLPGSEALLESLLWLRSRDLSTPQAMASRNDIEASQSLRGLLRVCKMVPRLLRKSNV